MYVIRRCDSARLYAVVGGSADKEGRSSPENGFRVQLISHSQPRAESEFIAIEKIVVATAGGPIGDAAATSTVLRVGHVGVEVIVTAILFFSSGGVIVAQPELER